MRTFIAVLLAIGASTFAFAAPDPCSLPSSISDARLTIEIKDRRSQFVEGEIIPVVMSFTSTAEKRYWADVRNYDRSGRLGTETYCLEPATPDPLEDYFRTGAFMGGGLGSTEQLSDKPFTATAELNEWRQPAPGHYRLYVVSHRVWRPPDPGEPTPYGRVAETLRSNEIEFDVTKADPGWRSQALQDAVAAYASGDVDQKKEAARKLRFLNTKGSVDAITTLFWGLNDQPGGWDLMFGLFASSNRNDAIAALKREISNPTHPITQEFLHTIARLEIGNDRAWDPPTFDPAHPEVSQDYWKKRQAHERELTQAAVAAAAAALPLKTGQAHALTVQALAQSSDLLNSATAAVMRRELIAAWNDLPEHTKQELIEYRWSLIAGPEMLPILKEFVSRPAPPFRTSESMARDAALKHIYELDAAEGRALILRDLRDPKAQPSISLVKLLSAEEVRPIVHDAVARIEKSDARELDYHLLELFADDSALPAVKRVFNEHLGEWACDPQGAMLRYFLKFDLEFGTTTVQESLARRKMTGCYRMLLQDLGKSVPKVEQVAIGALDDGDLEVANDAALSLGKWGTAKAESALWARLKRFHQQWEARENELRPTPEYNSALGRATALESTLVNSIATGTNWICGPEKFERLRAIASPRQQIQISAWSKLWGRGEAVVLPNWFPEDQLSFGVLQYSNLDEEQFRAKLSQMPGGMKLYFQMWKPGQIAPPVTMERQETVFRSLRDYAAKFGVTLEPKSD
jgi:hypothetical protein